jgi:hypothetical protein
VDSHRRNVQSFGWLDIEVAASSAWLPVGVDSFVFFFATTLSVPEYTRTQAISKGK